MTPQEVATRLTENYFSRFNVNWLLDHEFKGKTSLEAYAEVFNTFFEQAAKDINENTRKLNDLN